MREYVTEIISVGTELLLGHVTNTDARDVSEMLSKIGINVLYHTVVGDNPARIENCVKIARDRADIIITTGGLGPTCDDITKEILAKTFGLKLVRNEKEHEGLYDYIRQGRKFTDNNFNQAMLPEGCTVFHNNCGTAPGCAFEKDGKVVLITTSSVREANEMDQKVLACLEQSRQKHGYPVVSGEISHGIIGISLSYQNALDKYIYVHRRIASARYYFPAEWETQLANGLYAGAFQVAERILNETWRENQRRMEAGSLSMTDQLTLLSSLEMTICRTVQEMGLEMPAALAEMEKMNSLEDGWRNMLAACSQICREIAALNTPARDPVVEYVEKHFDDPDMSMDMLSEKFQLSAPTIIKRFKQSTNETFYACLLRLRIERAKELILAGSLTSADIARKIGYESDTSFQRAFKRCVGMSPKEYAASSVKPTEQE